MDVFISGSDADGTVNSLLYLKGEDGFVLNEVISDTIIDLNISSSSWQDFDNDNDFDLVITGFNEDGDRQFGFYVNDLFEPTYASLNKNKVSRTNIYPNPNSGEFVIMLEEGMSNRRVDIRGVQGNLVYSGNMNSTKMPINLVTVNPGTYIMTITSDQGVETELIVIQ